MNRETMNIIVGPARNRALIHVVNALAYESFLCDYVRARVDFHSGNFLTIDPANRHFDQIEDFAWGSGAGHDNGIAKRLLNSLTSTPNRFMLIDDVMGDISSADSSSFIDDGQIFHWINGANATDDRLNNLVWATGVSWHFLGVVFSGKTITDVPQRILERKYVELGEIVEVIVGAYDGEGFIHWRPD